MFVSTVSELPEGCKVAKIFGYVNSMPTGQLKEESDFKRRDKTPNAVSPPYDMDIALEVLIKKVQQNFEEANAIIGARTIVGAITASGRRSIDPSYVTSRYYMEGTAVKIEGPGFDAE